MALLSKLTEVRDVKDRYLVLQKEFYGELVNRFPYIMTKDMADVTNKLEEELHLMLCCSLRHTSVKIPLKAMERYSSAKGTTIVNVQRGCPGFYYPRSERGRTDIHYMKLQQYINDKDDMYVKYQDTQYTGKHNDVAKKVEKDVMLVGLAELRKAGKRVIDDKLDEYFRLLREIMAYRPKFLCYVSEGYHSGIGRKFKEADMMFALMPMSVDIQIIGKKAEKPKDEDEDEDDDYDDGFDSEYEEGDVELDLEPTYRFNSSGENHFRYDESPNDLNRMLDYNGSKNDNDFDSRVHERLKLFIDNYNDIRRHLDMEEAAKKQAYETCQDFLRQLRVHTVPFKVLGEITGR
jgi:hypothetical protein